MEQHFDIILLALNSIRPKLSSVVNTIAALRGFLYFHFSFNSNPRKNFKIALNFTRSINTKLFQQIEKHIRPQTITKIGMR